MTLNLTYKLIAEEDLTPDHHQRISHLLVKAFPNDVEIFSQASYCYSRPEYRLLIEDEDGVLIAHLDLERRLISVNGEGVYIAGIGEVATHPEYLRQGFGSKLMNELTAILTDDLPVDFGFLQCSDENALFYGQVGWHRIHQPLHVFYKGEFITFDDGDMMILPIRKTIDEWQSEGIVDVKGQSW
jgi:aminoglycoside 2'-N-acetyltransferase I